MKEAIVKLFLRSSDDWDALPVDQISMTFSVDELHDDLEKINPNKAPGPDGFRYEVVEEMLKS